jgi:hypothetical protein
MISPDPTVGASRVEGVWRLETQVFGHCAGLRLRKCMVDHLLTDKSPFLAMNNRIESR